MSDTKIFNASMRWPVLILCCLSGLAFYANDFPGILSVQLIDELGLTAFQYNMLHSIVHIPNIVMPIFNGGIVDYIGGKKALLLFLSVILFSQILCTYAVKEKSYEYLLMGRLIYGLASDGVHIASQVIIFRWFRKYEFGLGMGLLVTVGRLSTAIVGIWYPMLHEDSGMLYTPLLVGTFIAIFSVFCIIVILYIDQKYTSEQEEEIIQDQIQYEEYDENQMNNENLENKENQKNNENQKTPKNEQQQQEKDKGEEEEEEEKEKEKEKKQHDTEEEKDIKQQIKQFLTQTNKLYWIANIFCACAYGIYFPLIQNMNIITNKIYNLDAEQSGFVYSTPFFMAAFLIPIIGYCCDKYGYRVVLLNIGVLSIISALIIFWNQNICQNSCVQDIILPIILVGLFYSLLAGVVWIIFPMTVILEILGKALGVVLIFQNLVISIVPLIIGYKMDENEEWFHPVLTVFGVLAFIILVLGIFLQYYDSVYHKILNYPNLSNEKSINTERPTGNSAKSIQGQENREYQKILSDED